jgi:hypothetical protein
MDDENIYQIDEHCKFYMNLRFGDDKSRHEIPEDIRIGSKQAAREFKKIFKVSR